MMHAEAELLERAREQEGWPPYEIVEATPFEKLLAVCNDQEVAELLQAERTDVAAAVAAAATAAKLVESFRRLALGSLLQDRLILDSPGAAAHVRLLHVLPLVRRATARKVMVQRKAESALKTAMIASAFAHGEARQAISHEEHMEKLAALADVMPDDRRPFDVVQLMGWSVPQVAAAFTEASATARRLVRADKQGLLLVEEAELRVAQAGLCPACILHRMRLAPADTPPSALWGYDRPLEFCIH